MANKASVARMIGSTIRRHPGLSVLLILAISLSVLFSLLPPLVLEKTVNALAAGEQVLLSMAIGYFSIVAISGLLDSVKESLITAFGQKATHQIRSAMSEKLKRLPSAYLVEREPGVTVSRFVNDVNTVDHLFSSGIISMAADLCKLLSILIIIFTKSIGLGLMLTAITPPLFWMTRKFQTRMLRAQMDHRIAVARTSQQIPETLKNMRTIRILHQEDYMYHRYGNTIEQSFRAQERSNFYDAVYSPIIVSVSALLVGIMMAASGQSGAVQGFFGMSVGTAAAMIAYVGSFFTPLESIGMEIQNVQSAVAGVQRINEFLREEEQAISPGQIRAERAAVRLSDVCFRYRHGEQEILHQFNLTVAEGESIILAGRTGAGKSTLVKLIAGLYQPQCGEVLVFGRAADSIPESEKRRWFGYVEQQFRLVPGSVADQVSLSDPQVSEAQIRQALDMVGLREITDSLPNGIHTPCTESLFSQGQFQLLAIARAVVLDPKLLLLDEITANLDSRTEKLVLSALRAASLNRTVISVSHRLYGTEDSQQVRFVTM